MKKIIIVFAALLLLVGCEDLFYTEKKSISNETTTHYSNSFDYFDGVKEKNMKIKDGDEVDVSFTINIEEGSMKFYIKDEEGTILEEVESSKTVTIKNENTTLYLVVEADEAKGSFIIDWDN